MVLPLLIPLAHALLTHGGIVGIAHAGAGHMTAQQIITRYGKTILTNHMKSKVKRFVEENYMRQLSAQDYRTVINIIETSQTIGQVINTLTARGIIN